MISILLLNFLLAGVTYASEKSLLVVTNSQQSLHHLFITQLRSRLAADNITINITNFDDWQATYNNNHKLIVTLGNKAALQVSQHKPANAVLHSLIPAAAHTKIYTERRNCAGGKCSALFIDQPTTRIFQLAKLALPNISTIGLLTSPQSTIDLNKIESIAAAYSVNIQHHRANNTENIVFNLTDILQHSDALLALPDHAIYSPHTAQNILLTAYRYRKPIIGYSRAFVKAGALFAVHSTPSQLSQHTAEVIRQFFAQDKSVLPPAQYPRYFSVSVNTRVAKSMGIDIQNETILQEQLEATANE